MLVTAHKRRRRPGERATLPNATDLCCGRPAVASGGGCDRLVTMQEGVPFRGQVIAQLGDQRVVCTGGTISASGMELLSPQRAKLGQFVRVAFQLEEGGHWLDADALLISQSAAAQAYSWGLQFQAVPPHVAALIARHVEAATTGQAPRPARGKHSNRER